MKSFCVLNQALNENTGKIIGAAVCTAMGKKIGILHSGDESADASSAFLACGVSDAGGTALLFGCCNESRVAFLTVRYALSACFYVSDDYVSVYGADGKPVGSDKETVISQLASSDLSCQEKGDCVRVNSDLSYFSSLVECCGNLEDVSADIKCRNRYLSSTLKQVFAVSGGSNSKKPCFYLSESGNCVSACDERGKVLTQDNLLNICCACNLMDSKPVTVSMNSPRCLDELAEQKSVTLSRSFVGGNELWQNDGAFLVAAVLRLMSEKGEGLSTLSAVIPESVSLKKSFVCSLPPDAVANLIDCAELITDVRRGIYARLENGDVLITPCRNNGVYCMEVTATDSRSACEIAQELCLTINGN